ncbi:MAG: ABC-F family ATP-binding cassette domain-containing protein, partial [Alphaproteobacteria bacterium]|nr:ABC-F family ATP-binding cassette domain-containing protein [Alphaproteobacteria bacterium]
MAERRRSALSPRGRSPEGAVLHITDLVYRVAGRPLFDGASATIPGGHFVGLVGRNGAGKTTILRLIAGALQPDGGTITVAPAGTIGILPQEAPRGAASVFDFVLAADVVRARLLAEAATATDALRLAEVHAQLDDIGAAAAPARAAAILAGLGFDAKAQTRPLDTFSGGWRMRAALATLLFTAPDLLLLDEPSNHLDLEARLWLEVFLKRNRGTTLLVSHDRALLNALVGGILHLSQGRLAFYRGNYDAFERASEQRQTQAAARLARQEAQRARIQTFIDRFRAKATKARQVQSRIKALTRLEAQAPERADPAVIFDLPAPSPRPGPLLRLEGAAVGYGDTPILRRLDLTIDRDDRIALLGANGNGKTTLLRLFAGTLRTSRGTLTRVPKLRTGYFVQEQADALDPAATPLAHVAALEPPRSVQARYAHLGRFGLGQERAEQAIGALSGGEKARLLLATVMYQAPHLLLLDEPTNHLDMASREALAAALMSYAGAVVLVSHDFNLIDLCADRLWLVADGTVRPFDGDLAEYRACVTA